MSAANKDLLRNEHGRSIDQSLLSVGEMVRRAPGWARRVLTMTGFFGRGLGYSVSDGLRPLTFRCDTDQSSGCNTPTLMMSS